MILIWTLLWGCSDYKLLNTTDPTMAEDSGVYVTPLDTAPEPDPNTPDCDNWHPPTPYSVNLNESCLREPTVGTFTPTIEWQWNSNPFHSNFDDIMAAPAVGNLTDDNGDGRVDELDIPDIVFSSFANGAYSSAGTITAISGDGSQTHWSVLTVDGQSIYGSSGIAIGDFEGDGFPEVCVAGVEKAVICLNGVDGTLKWMGEGETSGYGCPAFADLDRDGQSELIYGRQIYNAQGQRIALGTGGTGGSHFMSFGLDWDKSGDQEVIAGNTIYSMDGNIVWQDNSPDGAPAIGDFNGDGYPDMIRTGGGSIWLVDNSGTLVWSQPLPGGGNGGAPTVADFDGDGAPETGVADLSRYSVFDTDGSLLWSNTVSDYSSSKTGSSVFDFQGDGSAEVVYSDENTLWIFDGATGAVLMEQSGHASGTLMEYPLIADVDNDDSTEIIVASNDYSRSGWNGITVIGDADSSWVPARPIWNQYSYNITNVNNDGSIPSHPVENWLSWNNFRAGGTELGPNHWLPDIQPNLLDFCDITCEEDRVTFSVSIENLGLVDSTGIAIKFSDDQDNLLLVTSLSTLNRGKARYLPAIELTREEWTSSLSIFVDHNRNIEECNEANNTLNLGPFPCSE